MIRLSRLEGSVPTRSGPPSSSILQREMERRGQGFPEHLHRHIFTPGISRAGLLSAWELEIVFCGWHPLNDAYARTPFSIVINREETAGSIQFTRVDRMVCKGCSETTGCPFILGRFHGRFGIDFFPTRMPELPMNFDLIRVSENRDYKFAK